MRVLGVDPGLSGALFLAVSPGEGVISPADCRVLDMPVVDVEGMKNYVSGALLRDWLLNEAKAEHAFIERVNAMPVLFTRKKGADGEEQTERRPMPATSAFQQGDGYGSVRTAIEVCGVPWELVSSPDWKRIHRLKGSDKEASRRRAIELLPGLASLFARKKDQGRAEAALIALAGLKLLGPQMGVTSARTILSGGGDRPAAPRLFD
jgi:hypothetical protein